MGKVGKVAELVRHPVKALRGESLQECRVDSFGLYGDRSHYFGDGTKEGRPLSPDKCPSFVEYTARFIGDGTEKAYPPVEVTSPSGDTFTWGEASFFAEMEKAAKLPIMPFSRTPMEGGENWDGHILIVTDASLRELQRAWGKGAVDHRRFRANVVVALDEDRPFQEDEWLGKRLQIGDVELQVHSHCERCHAINIDPASYEIDTSLLKTVVKQRENRFGVYASVVRTGSIKVDDEVHVVAESI